MKSYLVLDDVEMIDGRRVPVSRVVQLADAAARYELDCGKIIPVDEPARTFVPVEPESADAVQEAH